MLSQILEALVIIVYSIPFLGFSYRWVSQLKDISRIDSDEIFELFGISMIFIVLYLPLLFLIPKIFG